MRLKDKIYKLKQLIVPQLNLNSTQIVNSKILFAIKLKMLHKIIHLNLLSVVKIKFLKII
jgi:hypothetical protein